MKIKILQNGRLKMKMNIWIGFLSVLVATLIFLVIKYQGHLIGEIAIEVLGASIFVLLISVVFRKIMI